MHFFVKGNAPSLPQERPLKQGGNDASMLATNNSDDPVEEIVPI